MSKHDEIVRAIGTIMGENYNDVRIEHMLVDKTDTRKSHGAKKYVRPDVLVVEDKTVTDIEVDTGSTIAKQIRILKQHFPDKEINFLFVELPYNIDYQKE